MLQLRGHNRNTRAYVGIITTKTCHGPRATVSLRKMIVKTSVQIVTTVLHLVGASILGVIIIVIYTVDLLNQAKETANPVLNVM